MRILGLTILFSALATITFGQSAPQKTFSERLDGIQASGKELTKNASTDNSSIGQAGNLSTSIPLVNVKSRTLEFPLQLQYTAGIKVDQKSGPVGLGWTMPVGSILRDYGAFEPDYTSTSGEGKMWNTNGGTTGYLNPGGNSINPLTHNEALGYGAVDVDGMNMGLNDEYHVSVPGFIGGTFWNKSTLGASHSWTWDGYERWNVNTQAKTFVIDQEFTRINEMNLFDCPNCTNKSYFGTTGSYAAAIGVFPYVENGEARIPTSIPAFGNELLVKYEDFEEFTITDDRGMTYVFGRPLRGQKFVFSDNPYWSTSSDASFSQSDSPKGNFWKVDYIAEWLITEIRSADYEDLNGNGVADDDDAGDWIRFEYTDQLQVVETIPMSIGGKMERSVPKHREWSSFSQTDQASSLMRERAYLTKIVTPLQELDFTISERFDVDHDYFSKPANKDGSTFYFEDREFSSTGSGGDETDFDIYYPIETMKYDTVKVYSRVMDKLLYPDENLLTGAVLLNYAAKGSSDELAVSDYLIRNNDDTPKLKTNGEEVGKPSDGTFSVSQCNDSLNKRGKTTLLSIDLLDGEMNPQTKTSYTFDYGYNPDYSEVHKREIMRKWAFPSIRQSGSPEANAKATSELPYDELVLSSNGTTYSTVNHTTLESDEFLIDFPYNETYYKLESSATPFQLQLFVVSENPQHGTLARVSEVATQPLTPIKDQNGYLYADLCDVCPSAWSLTSITHPSGAIQTFEYEKATFDYAYDKDKWSFDETEIPLIKDYNSLAKERSISQDAYNRYANSNYLYNSFSKWKELCASYEVEMPGFLGIRLKKMTMDDRINPVVETNYTYGDGHVTALPSDFLANYLQGFNSFLMKERHKHEWENPLYMFGMLAALPGFTNDYNLKMPQASKSNLQLDDYNSTLFYETIDNVLVDNSFTRRVYSNTGGNIDYSYPNYEVYCTRLPQGGSDGNFVLGGNANNTDPILLSRIDYFESGQTSPYKSKTYEHTFVYDQFIDLLIDYGSGSNTLELYNNQFEIWLPVSDLGWDGFNYWINGTDIGPQTASNFTTWSRIDGQVDAPAFGYDKGQLVDESASITSTNALFQKWGQRKVLLDKEIENYKGLITTKEFTYDLNDYYLKQESASASFTNEVYITTYEYANESYNGITTLFDTKNMLMLPCKVNKYLNSVQDANIISAEITTYDYTSFSTPRPLASYQLEKPLSASGTCTLEPFSFAMANNPYWRKKQSFPLDYNNEGALVLGKENRLYEKTVFGSNNGLNKASFSYPLHSFDATYTGFEDLDGRYMIDDWTNTNYKDESWFVDEKKDINEPAYSYQLGNNPCHSPTTSCIPDDRHLNVVTIDNLNGVEVGDLVEIELIPSVNAATSTNILATTIVEGIYPTIDYYNPPGGGNINVKDYIVCFTDLLDYPDAITLSSCGTVNPMVHAQYTLDDTKFKVITPKYTLSDRYARTGQYSYQLQTQRDINDPYKKTPIRPVKIEAMSAGSECITASPSSAKSSPELITDCFWKYEASLWLNFSQDLVTTVPAGSAVQKSADANADAIYRREPVTDVQNSSRVKIICDIWNSDRSLLVDQYIYYPENLSAHWQQYTVDIPVRRGGQRWLDVYVVNEKAQHGTINTQDSKSLFVDDICVYPKGSKYRYSTFDKFTNVTFDVNNDDVFTETVYDQKGRPIIEKNSYATVVSEMEYFENPTWLNQMNHITQRQWVDNGSYNETRYYLDGLGKTKQVMTADIDKNARIVSETHLYNNKGQAYRSYKPYALSGSGFGDGHNVAYDAKTQALHGSNYAFTTVNYEAWPEERVSSVQPPRTNAESTISASQSDYVSSSPLTHPYMLSNNVFPSGTMLIHETVDALGNKVWTYMDNLGRVIMEEHEIGNDYTQNTDGSITDLGTGYTTSRTWFVYDPAGNIVKVVDPNGKETTYTYNSLGVVTQKVSADEGIASMQYDKYGQVRFTRNSKDDAAVSSNTWGTDQFSYMKYDEWGRAIEAGFMNAAPADPTGVFTSTVFFADTAYLNDQEFPDAASPLVQVHTTMTYDGSRDQFNSDKVLSTSVMSNHTYAASLMTYSAGTTDTKHFTYMADGQAAKVEYEYDGLANMHSFEPVYNSRRIAVGKKYTHPTNSLWNFEWSNELDDLGRINKTSTTHNSAATEHGTYYYDVLGNLLMRGIGNTGNQLDPHMDYQVTKWDIRDQIEHFISKDFRFGLEHDVNGNIISQYWSNEHFDPTTGSTSDIHKYSYSYDEMTRLIAADYSETSVSGDPFAYFDNISDALPNDFDCSVNEVEFDVVFDPIFSEMDDNIANRVNVTQSSQVINSLGVLKVEYLANNVPYAIMTGQEIDLFLTDYITAASVGRGNPLAWEKYRADQLNDTEHLNALNGSATPALLKYTKIALGNILYVPAVNCDPNPNATIYGYLPTFPYPTSTTNTTPYDVAVWYSENGNITDLNRNDDAGVRTEQDYTYGVATKNQLTTVNWTVSGVPNATHNYQYDLTGNLLDDPRNGVTNIDYISFNNMPQSITNGSGTTEYRYDANNTRSVKELGVNDVEYYMDGVILDENGDVLSYATPEGYAIPVSSSVRYFYYGKDWLGTNRAVYAASGLLKNVTDHYPFGERMPGRWYVSTNDEGKRYQFTGHEYDGDTEYGYHGARYYNRELGKYMSVDPLASKFFGWSAYNYTMNNPINMIDPDGKAPDWIDNGDGTYTAEAGDSQWTLYDQHLADKGMTWEDTKSLFKEGEIITPGSTKRVFDTGSSEMLEVLYEEESALINQIETATKRVQKAKRVSQDYHERIVNHEKLQELKDEIDLDQPASGSTDPKNGPKFGQMLQPENPNVVKWKEGRDKWSKHQNKYEQRLDSLKRELEGVRIIIKRLDPIVPK